jgi:hypothetical protein
MSADFPTCRIEILTEDDGILSPELTGLPCMTQAARVLVTSDDASVSHVIVRSAEPLTKSLPHDHVVRKMFPGSFVSCEREDAMGATTISCPTIDEASMLQAACAAATLKRAWGWDESPTIIVRFASSELVFDVNPIHEDGTWTVSGIRKPVEELW